MGQLGQYNANPKTRADGESVYYDETDSKGNKKVTLGTLAVGETAGVNAIATKPMEGTDFNINTATTTVVKSSPGRAIKIWVVGGTMGNVTIYNNTAASGATLLATTTPAIGTVLVEDEVFSTGLTIVTTAATALKGKYI